MLGLVFAVGQILTGINAIMYFAPQIFSDAGFTSATAAIVATIIVGVVNVLATFVAIRYIDRFGRRPLLIVGLTIMVASGLTIALVSMTMGTGWRRWLHHPRRRAHVRRKFRDVDGPCDLGTDRRTLSTRDARQGDEFGLERELGTNLVLSLAFLPLMQIVGTGAVFAGFAVINFALLVFVLRSCRRHVDSRSPRLVR